MTVQCCKCKRIRFEAQWSAPAATLLQGNVSHTYCPACADECHIELFSTQASRATAVHAQQLLQQLGGVA
ncbi:MAG TPA: hypothetical protein PLJ47_13900 [Candidatus Hydrogenedentes bacterium]|nr:hypothetical protein [Candidatus Hydrogenedentota bacterium]HRK35684.1 hypothetical protein [Candidatus Hydrogenedentota bacterium]